jgi:MFS family permease
VNLWPRGLLWRHGDFLRLWAAQTISQFGSQVSLIALPLVAIVALNASALEVALLGAVEMLPFLLIALPAGVWVDRLPRRPILVIGDLGRAVALASIPAAWAADTLTIWQLYVVGFVVGVFTVFFDVAYQSYLPSLVERGQLVEGNAKLEVSRSAAQLAGPGAGGVLVGSLGGPYAILVDTLSFVWSGLLVGRIRRYEAPHVPQEQPNMRRELMEGLRYLFGDPRWRAIAIYVASANFFSSLMFSIFLVYVVRELDFSAELIGLTLALGNIGWLVAAVIARRVSGRFGVGRTLVVAGALGGMPLLLIPIAPRDAAVPFFVAALIIVSLGAVLFNVTGISLQQALTPTRMLGRMNASRRWVVWGTIPLGSATGGVLAETIGLRPTLFVGAIGASLAFLVLLVEPLRTIEGLPEDGETAQAEDLVELPLETQSAET